MKFIYWFLHIQECPENDLHEEYNGKLLVCNKCGRKHFVFKTY